jgi:hypothetical protein
VAASICFVTSGKRQATQTLAFTSGVLALHTNFLRSVCILALPQQDHQQKTSAVEHLDIPSSYWTSYCLQPRKPSVSGPIKMLPILVRRDILIMIGVLIAAWFVKVTALLAVQYTTTCCVCGAPPSRLNVYSLAGSWQPMHMAMPPLFAMHGSTLLIAYYKLL